MWLRLLLCAVMAAAETRNKLMNVYKYIMPEGIPDGTLITFYFKHVGEHIYWEFPEPESVKINFYDLPDIPIDEVYDINAHLKFERLVREPVASNSFINGKWQKEVRPEMSRDITTGPLGTGWWRVDVYKHDMYNLNVFFDGFWADVRTFAKSLDDVKSIYIISDNIEQGSVDIRLKLPDVNKVPPMSVAYFKNKLYSTSDYKLCSFPSFPINGVIEMAALIKGSGWFKGKYPALVFVPKSGGPFIMKILQIWHGYKHRYGRLETYLTSNPDFVSHGDKTWIWQEDRDSKMAKLADTTLCTKELPNGDLQHLYLQRISRNEMKLRVFYKESEGLTGTWCVFKVPDHLVSYLDQPIDIISHEGAMMMFMTSSMPNHWWG